MTVTVDTASITGITTDTGSSGSDFITSDHTLVFGGNVLTSHGGGGGGTVAVWISGGTFGTANGGKGTLIGSVNTIVGNGAWSFNGTGTDIADGNYTIRITNSTSTGSTAMATQSLTIDSTVAAAILRPDRIIDSTEVGNASFTISGVEAGATATVTFSDGVNPDVIISGLGNGTFSSANLSSLNQGIITSSIVVTDIAGNVSTAAGVKTELNTSSSLAATIAGWNSYAAAEAAENNAFSTITIVDKRANIQALSTTDIADLGAGGVTNVDATNNALSLSVAQYNAFLTAGIAFTASDAIILADTGANLGTVLGTDLQGNGVDFLDASDNVLSISLAELDGLGTVTLTRTDTVTLADAGAVIEGLLPAEITALAARNIDILDATDDSLSLSLAQFNALGNILLTGADDLTVTGTGANDIFSFSKQTFGSSDSVVGGAGTDTLALDGDYTLAFGASSLSSIEKMTLRGGHSYDLTMVDANVAAGAQLAVSGKGLTGADTFSFNGSAELDGVFLVQGGAGTNTITGGSGADTLQGGTGTNILAGGGGADKIYAGGTDTIVYTGVSESTGTVFDMVDGFNAAADKFDLTSFATVAGMEDAITTGFLRSGAAFDSSLAKAVNSTNLHANNAVMFTADSGNLAGVTFLVVDINGVAGYDAGADLLVRMTNTSGTIGIGNFAT